MTKQAFSKYVARKLNISEEAADNITRSIINNYAHSVVEELKKDTVTDKEFMAGIAMQLVLFETFLKKNVLIRETADSFIKGYMDGLAGVKAEDVEAEEVGTDE